MGSTWVGVQLGGGSEVGDLEEEEPVKAACVS